MSGPQKVGDGIPRWVTDAGKLIPSVTLHSFIPRKSAHFHSPHLLSAASPRPFLPLSVCLLPPTYCVTSEILAPSLIFFPFILIIPLSKIHPRNNFKIPQHSFWSSWNNSWLNIRGLNFNCEQRNIFRGGFYSLVLKRCMASSGTSEKSSPWYECQINLEGQALPGYGDPVARLVKAAHRCQSWPIRLIIPKWLDSNRDKKGPWDQVSHVTRRNAPSLAEEK